MTDDYWSSLAGREDVPDEEAIAMFGEPSPTNPATVGVAFVAALDRGATELLHEFVTPESRDEWGDFSEAIRAVRALKDYGAGSIANRALGAPDVAYLKIFENVSSTFVVHEEQVVQVPMTLTMVWRPEHDLWMVHAIGPQVPPEGLPRTSPGEAPGEG